MQLGTKVLLALPAQLGRTSLEGEQAAFNVILADTLDTMQNYVHHVPKASILPTVQQATKLQLVLPVFLASMVTWKVGHSASVALQEGLALQ